MTADISRNRAENAKQRQYSSVLMQQGRLMTDSDWNEGFAIAAERSEAAMAVTFGRAGTPKADPGFAIWSVANGLQIGAGEYWVDGLRLHNGAALNFNDQLGQTSFAASVADGADVFVWLEARRDLATPFDDPRLNDPALTGVDTAWREVAGWRVGLSTVVLNAAQRADLIQRSHCGHMPDLPEFAPSTGTMRVTTAPAVLSEDDDCLIPPEAGYLSQENQTYRIQIIASGTRATARFVWSRENGAVIAGLTRINGDFILTGAREDEALGFVSGGWVEAFDDRTTKQGQPGSFHRLTLVNGVATFAPGLPGFDQMQNPKLRRWDHGGASALGVALQPGPVALERGLQVSFTAGSYRAGDAWVFEARAATGQPIWPPVAGGALDMPPMGWGRHYAPLALGRRQGATLAAITDLRAKVPALSCLAAEDVSFDDSNCAFEADTVQEAIEALCHRIGHGICTAVVRTVDELLAAVEALSARQSIRLCLVGTHFALSETLLFRNLGHVVIEGTGPQTLVSVASGEAAFSFQSCASVRVSDLAVNGGPTGTQGSAKGRLGALDARDCPEVSFERLRARTRAGLDRATACLATRDCRRVMVRDCVLHPAQAQIGVEVIGSRRAVIENNVMRPVPAREAGQTYDRIAADPVLVARMSRGLFWFAPRRSSLSQEITVQRARRGGGPVTMTLEELRGPTQALSLRVGRNPVNATSILGIAERLLSAIDANHANHIASVTEMRAHLRNILATCLRQRGRATIGRRAVSIFPFRELGLTDSAYIAQGIVVAGPQVDEVIIRANRIEGANEGIRVAASSRGDVVPPRWNDNRPENVVRRVMISQNTIALTPLSTATPAYGIFLGHADRQVVSENEVSGGTLAETEHNPPHFGIYQYGWRGPHLLWSANVVSDVFHGLVVMPQLREAQGLWRLRDNAAPNTVLSFVYDSRVEVL
jgi:hypothetical protein